MFLLCSSRVKMAEVSLIIASSIQFIQFSDTFFCPWLFFLIIVFIKFHLPRKKTFLQILFFNGGKFCRFVYSLPLFAAFKFGGFFTHNSSPLQFLQDPHFFLWLAICLKMIHPKFQLHRTKTFRLTSHDEPGGCMFSQEHCCLRCVAGV